MRFTFAGTEYEGARGRDARSGARPQRRPRRLPLALPRPSPRRLHGRARRSRTRWCRSGRASRCCARRSSSSRTASSPSRWPARGGSSLRRTARATTRCTRTATCSSSVGRPLAAASGRRGGVRRRVAPTSAGASRGRWVVGLYDHNYAIAVEHDRRLWRIRAKRIVLATGCHRAARRSSPTTTCRALIARERRLERLESPCRARRPSRAAGARGSTSGARPAAASAGTTGSARPCRTASCPGSSASAASPARASRMRPPSLCRTGRGRDVRRSRARRRPSPTSAARSAPAAAVGRARQALHDDRDRLRAGQARERERDPRRRRVAAASTRASSARRRSGRRTCRSRSRCSPAATAAPLFDPVRVTPIQPGTSRQARSSRTSASGSGRATSRATASMDAAVLRECAAAASRSR